MKMGIKARKKRRMFGMNLTKEQAQKLAEQIGGTTEGCGRRWQVWK